MKRPARHIERAHGGDLAAVRAEIASSTPDQLMTRYRLSRNTVKAWQQRYGVSMMAVCAFCRTAKPGEQFWDGDRRLRNCAACRERRACPAEKDREFEAPRLFREMTSRPIAPTGAWRGDVMRGWMT